MAYAKTDLRSLILQFWETSEAFPYHRFFCIFKFKLYLKLALHACLRYEDYIEEMYKHHPMHYLKEFVYISEHTGVEFDYQSIVDAIFKPRYKHFNKIYSESEKYKKLLKLYNRISSYQCEDSNTWGELVNDCIHAQHNAGFITGLNISELREEFVSKTKNN